MQQDNETINLMINNVFYFNLHVFFKNSAIYRFCAKKHRSGFHHFHRTKMMMHAYLSASLPDRNVIILTITLLILPNNGLLSLGL
ncbi:hypothetical protein PEC301645_01820 [Pectobacterium carotovorum subsp. carotovorum]|nr:hypothetical protein PEC301645_01820 [Pectobacterium carotovorum subsp. carotovorum]